METIDVRRARRLALVRGGLLRPSWTGLPQHGGGTNRRARKAALRIIQCFGYLQLDTVSIAGARSHAIVLMSRLDEFEPDLAEKLLQPGEPLFEYWGHEASWIPVELYGLFDFRRTAFRHHPWWGDLVGEHPDVADNLLRRIRDEGPLRSVDMEGRGSRGWWDLKLTKRVATALWSCGDLAIRERQRFQRTYDLTERVIPEHWRREPIPEREAIRRLLVRALEGHGWATSATLAQTWRLSSKQHRVGDALAQLEEQGAIIPCSLQGRDGPVQRGWIRPGDLDLADRLGRARPRRDHGVLLSPFDPVLWDRHRVQALFDFHQVLEIFKPAVQRVYGYYCLPVLAGDRLTGRFDLKADTKTSTLRVLSYRPENDGTGALGRSEDHEAALCALGRYARSLSLQPIGWS